MASIDKARTTDHPADIAPFNKRVLQQNKFDVYSIFPYKNWHSLPSLPAVINNLAFSVATSVAGIAGFFVTASILLPIGILKSVGSTLGLIANYRLRKQVQASSPPGGRRCVVINGASSGIGYALVREYAAPDTHLVLIARGVERLKKAAAEAEEKGATTSVHTLDFFKPDDITELVKLLHDLDRIHGGIDIAMAVASVTGHRADVVGRSEAADGQKEAFDCREMLAVDIDIPEARRMETGEDWGVTVGSRMTRVNVEANQAFIMTCWDLMKARRIAQKEEPVNAPPYHPKIVILGSSVAYFSTANFCFYNAAKSYLYTLGQSLQVLSAPFDIQITMVTPGFIESGMTLTMYEEGATVPLAVLGNVQKMARRIKKGEERNDRVVAYPLSQVLPLYGARAVNPLLEIFGLWFGSWTGMSGFTYG